MKKVSNIKSRIKELAINSGRNQEEFFEEIGSTSANFRGKKLETGVNSDLIDKIVSIYPSTDLHWLITGESEKNRRGFRPSVNEPLADYQKETIESLKQTIEAKNETIESLRAQLKMMKGNNGNPSKAS